MNSLIAKRIFDLVIGMSALVLSLPIGAIAAVAIKLDGGGPVLYRAQRAGQGGRRFTMFKFRTMVTSGDSRTPTPAITASGDPRVTRVGRILRLTKIDELPQLVNVLRGDMSIVGPRPEDPRYVSDYTDCQRKVLQLRPGITGPSAIAFRDEEAVLANAPDLERAYREDILPAKLAIDLDYCARRSMAGDVRLVARTILAVANGPSLTARYGTARK